MLDDKNVIKIEVRGSEKPYSAYGHYHMRSADEDRELSPTALKELLDRQTSSDMIFGQLGYVEQTGYGIPLIISNNGKQAFDIMENFVNVTILINYEKRIPVVQTLRMK